MKPVSRNRFRHGREPLVGHSDVRRRDAVERPRVTELEFVASRYGADLVRLKPAWPELFSRIRTLGPVVAVTRNTGAELVKTGIYAFPEFGNTSIGRVTGSIDLRLFTQHWKDAFVLIRDQGQRTRRCIYIFDRYGAAVHKVMLHPEPSTSAFADLVWNLHAQDQSTAISIEPLPSPPLAKRVDIAGLRDAFRAMSHTHEFGAILRSFNISREHTLRLIGGEYAWRVDQTSIREMLRRTVAGSRALTCFVENAGILHIHTGLIKRIRQSERWLSILDHGFNFHLDEASVAHVWVLRKPTRNGFVTSIEVYNRYGSLLVQFFGPYDAHGQESEHWRVITAALPLAADAD